MFSLFLSARSMLCNLVPDAVNELNFVIKQIFIGQTIHEFIYLSVWCHHKDSRALASLIFPLTEVIVELINKLLRVLESSDVSLTARISLDLDHRASLLRLYHIHCETCALNVSLILFGRLLIRCENSFLCLFQFLHFLKFFLDYKKRVNR